MKKTFVKVRSIKDIVVFVSLIIVGIILVVLPVDAGVSIAGFFCILVGVYNAENEINNMRNWLRESEIEDIEGNIKHYQTSVYYMDVVNELERMGDFMINISQDLERTFIKR